jgi:hypothetical protein
MGETQMSNQIVTANQKELFDAGRAAFDAGIRREDVPHSKHRTFHRSWWFKGWDDAAKAAVCG